MGILGGKFTDDDDDGGGSDAVTLPLDDIVCSVCGRDLAPWMTMCPDDGGEPMPRSESTADGPAVPLHLLAGLDDGPVDAGSDDASGDGTPDTVPSTPDELGQRESDDRIADPG